MSNLVTLRPKPGDVVEGVYHVECELGSDASSIVLGTVVPATGKRYALRYWLSDDAPAVANAMQHFVRVANNVKLFDNPGVVEVFGIGQGAGLYYSVTEWLEGTTLERFLDRNGLVPARDAVALLMPCLEGLAAAHAAGIVHGDLRPASVFLCRATRFEPERARLHKFSAARWADRPVVMRKRASQDIELRQYVSPEELQGELPDERSDVYSMGVLLYVMIAGRSPFSSIDTNHLAAEIVAGSFTPLTSRVAGVPADIAGAVARAMATDPTQRFSSCSELLLQLSGQQATRSGAELAKVDREPRTYKWIRNASEELSPSLFDLAPVDADDDSESRHERRNSRIVRVSAVLSCLLMAGAIAFRLQSDGEGRKRSVVKKRTTAGLVREVTGLGAANGPAAPDRQQAPRERGYAMEPALARQASDAVPAAQAFAPRSQDASSAGAQTSAPRTAPRASASEPTPSRRGPGALAITGPEPKAHLDGARDVSSPQGRSSANFVVPPLPGADDAVPAVRKQSAALDGMRLE